MLHDFPFYLGIIVLIVLLILVSDKIKVAYPIVLVLAGLAIILFLVSHKFILILN